MHKMHLIKCLDCDELVDAFDWLWDIVTRGEWLSCEHAYLTRQIEEKKKALEEVRRQVNNEKAKLKRLIA